jgi:hypothetical protein
MCVETRVTYTECYCTVTFHRVCDAHVQHTHRQIDNRPCQNYEVREVVTAGRGCEEGIPDTCPSLHRDEYGFETDEYEMTAEEQWTRHWEEEGRIDLLREEVVQRLYYGEEEEEEEEDEEDDEDDDDGVDDDDDDDMDDLEREQLVKKHKLEGEGEEKRKFVEDVDMDVEEERTKDSVNKKQKVVRFKEGTKVEA